jgi:UDP-glucuronate 4-epimerase
MKILVTGGAGFIGCHLARRLLSSGHQVVIVDNFNHFYDPAVKRANWQWVLQGGAAQLYDCDILNAEAMDRVFRIEHPERIIHLAAWAGVRPSLERPRLYAEVNVAGTAHLLELSKTYGIQQFIFGTTSSVYGDSSPVPFSEDDPISRPISPYAATKRAGELLCYTYAHNFAMPVTCLRFFTVYGPRQRPEMAIHKFARLIRDGQEVPMYGDGSSCRDYTYIDDILDGVMGALEYVTPYEIINLGESRTIELRELVKLLEAALGKTARIRTMPEQPGDMKITYADIS